MQEVYKKVLIFNFLPRYITRGMLRPLSPFLKIVTADHVDVGIYIGGN